MNVHIKVINIIPTKKVPLLINCAYVCERASVRVCVCVFGKGKRPNEETQAVGYIQTQQRIGAKINSQICCWPTRGGICAKKLSNKCKVFNGSNIFTWLGDRK